MNPPDQRDVFGVGNAIVDILAFIDDDFIGQRNLPRGSMTLMDSVQQADVLQGLETHSLKLASGGSAANSMVAIAQSGGSGYFAGKVAHDTHGEFYKKDMQDSGIAFDVELAPEASDPTGTSVILTTPDAERTMCTHLGISTSLSVSDINVDQLARCQYSYIEGYLWDAEHPRAACVEVMEQSKRRGVKVAFTFSDAFLVDRFPDDFKKVAREYADVLFCNIDECRQLCDVDSVEQCAEKLQMPGKLVFITDGEKGCWVVDSDKTTHVDAFSVKAIDTVGAGDAFAGGVLFGLTHGFSAAEAARWGNYLASRVVEFNGPRLPTTDVSKQRIEVLGK